MLPEVARTPMAATRRRRRGTPPFPGAPDRAPAAPTPEGGS